MKILKIVSVLPILFMVTVTNSHHSDAGYDREIIVVLDAVVTHFVFRNPHTTIFVEAEDPAGNVVEWEIETGSTPIMQRSGWSPDLLSPGDRIIVRAHPERSGRRIAILNTLETNDGALWSQIERDAEATESATTLSGVWKGITSTNLNRQLGNIELTAAAESEGANYDPQTDDPNIRCIASPPPFLNSTTNYLTGIEILEDQVILRNEFLDMMRAVYMDGRGHPVDGERTVQGHSIGYWEDDVLVVDTRLLSDFPEGNGRGVPSGAQKHVVERFSLSEDGTRAIVDVFMEDPEYLAEPFSGRTEMTYVPHLELYRYGCTPE
ncbi:MAG: DUF6152 family protein [Candidatus Rariloculaceae bacterium]